MKDNYEGYIIYTYFTLFTPFCSREAVPLHAGILSAFPVFAPREPSQRISGTLEPGCQLEVGGRNLRGRILVVNTTQPKCRILLQRDGFFRFLQRFVSAVGVYFRHRKKTTFM